MKKKKERIVTPKRVCILLLLLLLSFLVTFIGYIIYDSMSKVESTAFPLSVNVNAWGGFVPEVANTTVLDFYQLVPGQEVTRFINLTNSFDFDARVVVSTKGRIKRFLFVGENNFVIGPGETFQLNVTIRIPGVAYTDALKLEGNYDGLLIVDRYRV